MITGTLMRYGKPNIRVLGHTYDTLWQANIAPRYEFGFGLSYTTFEYSELSISGSIPNSDPPSGPGSSLDPS